MPPSEPFPEIRRLGRIGAIVPAEQAVDTCADGYHHPDDRAVALDILLRDLARPCTPEQGLDRVAAEVERSIDPLHREPRRASAHRAA